MKDRILTQLYAKGLTSIGNSSDYSGYIPLLNASGKLDSSFGSGGGGGGVTWPLVSTDSNLSFGSDSGSAAWIDDDGTASLAGDTLAFVNGQMTSNTGASVSMRIGAKANSEVVWSTNVDQNNSDAIDDATQSAIKFSIQNSSGYDGMQFQYTPANADGGWGAGGSTPMSLNFETGILNITNGIQLPNTTRLMPGTFNNDTGGEYGISLLCSIGYELNWQGGHLASWDGAAFVSITVDSPISINNTFACDTGAIYSDGAGNLTAYLFNGELGAGITTFGNSGSVYGQEIWSPQTDDRVSSQDWGTYLDNSGFTGANFYASTGIFSPLFTQGEGGITIGSNDGGNAWINSDGSALFASINTAIIIQQYQYITTDANVSVGNKYIADSSGGTFTITLPNPASQGNNLVISDAKYTWATNNVTVSPNELNINGSSDNLILNVSGKQLTFVYIDSDYGWAVY